MAINLSDDVIYGILLVISMPLGYALRHVSPGEPRRWLASGLGVLITVLVCGWHALHSLAIVLVNSLLVKVISPRRCHVWSFAWCFGYLAFFRSTERFGMEAPPGHANAIQLFLTLRLAGLAFEIHDSHKIKSTGTSSSQQMALKYKYCTVDPSFVDMFHYSYCFVGLLTGPFYKLRTYQDMIHQRVAIRTVKPTLARLKMVPLYALGFILASHFFSIKEAEKDSFYQTSFWWRLFFMVPMFFIFRMRLYIAWITAECSCMLAALGAYPSISKPMCSQGPTDLEAYDKIEDLSTVEYSFETIHNIDVAGAEFAPTAREGMRSWNMTVQSWLALNLYKRVPLKTLRNPLTMAVSAFWHGLHPGYYVSMLGIFPVVVAEKRMADVYRRNATPEVQRRFDFICWFFRMRAFEYLGMGFLLLSLEKTVRYMSSIYFVGHFTMTFFLMLGFMLKPAKVKTEEKKGN